MTDEKKELDDKLDALLKDKPSKRKVAHEVDASDLTEEEKAAIQAEAAAAVTKELKAAKRKEYLESEKQRLKKKALFSVGKDEEGDNLESVYIQLASFGDEIRLDGRRYIHGRSYNVGQKLAQTLKEIMFRGEKHDAEIHGKKMADFYGTRPRNPHTGSSVTLSPNNASDFH